MAFSLNHLGKPRRPYVAALAATLLFAGVIALEHNGFVTLPQPSDEMIASVLPGAVVALSNNERAERGLGNVRANALLTRAAQMKADDMASKSYYAHISPDGTHPPFWLNKVGYKYQIMGENLVIDRDNSDQVVSAWMGSPTHRDNLLNPSYTEIGIGVAHGTYKGRDTIYVVQMLARPLGGATQTAPAPKPKPAPAPAPKPVAIPAPKPAPAPAPKPAPAPAPTPAPAPVTRPVGLPALPRTNDTPPLVRPPAPKPVIQDPIAPILQTIASSTLIEVPSIVASSTYQQPALAAAAGEYIKVEPPAPAPVEPKPVAGQKLRSFFGDVGKSLKSFFSPIF